MAATSAVDQLSWVPDPEGAGATSPGMGGMAMHGSMGAMGSASDVPGAPAMHFPSEPTSASPVMGMMGSDDTGQIPLTFDSSADAFAPSSGGPGAGAYDASGLGTEWYDPDDMDNEPPLLKELGIDLNNIRAKLIAVIDPRSKVNMHVVQDGDLFGPLSICLALGFVLLLRGQVHFGAIYAFGLVGCVGMYLVLNLMASGRMIDAASVFGIFGYGLLPITVLATVSVFLSLSGPLGLVLAPVCVGWSAWCATRFFEAALGMDNHRALIAYPTCLLYAVFALLAIF